MNAENQKAFKLLGLLVAAVIVIAVLVFVLVPEQKVPETLQSQKTSIETITEDQAANYEKDFLDRQKAQAESDTRVQKNIYQIAVFVDQNAQLEAKPMAEKINQDLGHKTSVDEVDWNKLSNKEKTDLAEVYFVSKSDGTTKISTRTLAGKEVNVQVNPDKQILLFGPVANK